MLVRTETGDDQITVVRGGAENIIGVVRRLDPTAAVAQELEFDLVGGTEHLFDGDGGDENLKDYPIEENPELTIRSVVNNLMLYHEGWGVGRIKHSLTYSGGLSRGYVRTYAPGRKYGFSGFSPLTRPSVIAVSEAIPFIDLTRYDVPTLYSLKGEVIRRGIRALTGLEMPVFEKFPVIQSIKETLYDKGALYASMSGSGSSVYGIFKDIDIPSLNFPNHFLINYSAL